MRKKAAVLVISCLLLGWPGLAGAERLDAGYFTLRDEQGATVTMTAENWIRVIIILRPTIDCMKLWKPAVISSA